jgi:hypothetical protein
VLLPVVYLTVHGNFAKYTDYSSCCYRRIYSDLICLGVATLGVAVIGAAM